MYESPVMTIEEIRDYILRISEELNKNPSSDDDVGKGILTIFMLCGEQSKRTQAWMRSKVKHEIDTIHHCLTKVLGEVQADAEDKEHT